MRSLALVVAFASSWAMARIFRRHDPAGDVGQDQRRDGLRQDRGGVRIRQRLRLRDQGGRPSAYVVTNHHVIEPRVIQIVGEMRRGPFFGPWGPYFGLTPRIIAQTMKDAKATVVLYSGTPKEVLSRRSAGRRS